MSHGETTLAAEHPAEPGRPVYQLILIMTAAVLLILPFITTFNEFLTRVVINLGLQTILEDWVVPSEVRLIAVLLKFFGIPVSVSSTSIYLEQGTSVLPVYVSWNCVGWQSFILFLLTLITGIQGPYTRRSKIEAAILGLLAIFLINLIRISGVVLIAFYVGQLPAILIHDYAGTIFILIWLFAYWYFVHGWILEPLETLPEGRIEERPLRETYQKTERQAEGNSVRRWLRWLKRRPKSPRST